MSTLGQLISEIIDFRRYMIGKKTNDDGGKIDSWTNDRRAQARIQDFFQKRGESF